MEKEKEREWKREREREIEKYGETEKKRARENANRHHKFCEHKYFRELKQWDFLSRKYTIKGTPRFELFATLTNWFIE